MRTAVVIICLNSGSSVKTLASESINIAKSFNFTIPKNTMGQLFEIYAYTNDIHQGTLLISIK